MKGSADASYATYIVLYNRYDNDAKIYVSTFKDAAVTGGEPIMVSTGQIVGKEFIPADGKLVITDADIQAFLAANGITWDPAEGIPVKFNIRVPSQAGSTSFSGTYAAGSLSGSITGVNPFDPFVEGIVVSTSPVGQRSIPLKFKTFKQGQYGH
ncbi:MAG: hypothetical protein EHM27_01395 [Deltaproteobacteria bacterium]|nr:MAG: hypothetical protein EHM27_01395 [Deltaproteobacteria bacterium]